MAHYLLGVAYFGGVPNRPAAIQAFEKAHSLSKNVTEKERYEIEIGYAEEIEGNKDKVAALIKQYAAKYPKEKEAHSYLGSFYFYVDSDPEKAIEEYNIALSLDPNLALAPAPPRVYLSWSGRISPKPWSIFKGMRSLDRMIPTRCNPWPSVISASGRSPRPRPPTENAGEISAGIRF